MQINQIWMVSWIEYQVDIAFKFVKNVLQFMKFGLYILNAFTYTQSHENHYNVHFTSIALIRAILDEQN